MSLRLLCGLLLVWSMPALADLYRWLDPETGSVKFSSYPPPWYGDAEKEKRAPRVEHIPERKPAAATPVPAPAGANGLPAQGDALPSLDAQRKSLLLELGSASMQKEQQSGGTGLQKQLESFAQVSAQMDKLDPAGADRRRAEAQQVLQKLVDSLRGPDKAAPPAAPASR